MFGILARSQVVRVGMFGEGHPYVVPVSFGMEVAGGADVLDILWRCDTARIGMSGPDGPYVVPVSFGMEVADGRAALYFHCARKGLKADLLASDSRVCVEGDIFLGYEVERHGITTRYESAIGFGRCEIVEDDGEILKGLRLICEHCGFSEVPLDTCLGLAAVRVYRVDLESVTGKRNLPGSE